MMLLTPGTAVLFLFGCGDAPVLDNDKKVQGAQTRGCRSISFVLDVTPARLYHWLLKISRMLTATRTRLETTQRNLHQRLFVCYSCANYGLAVLPSINPRIERAETSKTEA